MIFTCSRGRPLFCDQAAKGDSRGKDKACKAWRRETWGVLFMAGLCEERAWKRNGLKKGCSGLGQQQMCSSTLVQGLYQRVAVFQHGALVDRPFVGHFAFVDGGRL